MSPLFAEIVLPFPLGQTFTYAVPEDLIPQVAVGMRTEVTFRNKVYTGLVCEIHDRSPSLQKVKSILSLPDPEPVINEEQLKFWKWIAAYYLCTLGEVYAAAMPAYFKLGSETHVLSSGNWDATELEDKEFIVGEALRQKNELSLDEIRKLLQIKNVQPVIRTLIEKGLVLIKEEMKPGYKPKTKKMVSLAARYHDEEEMEVLFADLERARKQQEILMMYYQLAPDYGPLAASVLLRRSGASASTLKSMLDKGIFIQEEMEVDRIVVDAPSTSEKKLGLSELQQVALASVRHQLEEKGTVLLHGITGSGKTEIYIQLIEEYLQKGKQVLYLLPEIALTAQIINRLTAHFGNSIGVYHSRFNHNERVELWRKVYSGSCRIVLGARSAVMLPYKELGLVIVDEEHDYSYKQQDPAPRYQARDTAVFLSTIFGSHTLLGTATPSLESFYNAKSGKYGYVELNERYGGVPLPEIKVVALSKQKIKGAPDLHISKDLEEAIQSSLLRKEQVILFQNRRGYSPTLLCAECGWSPECVNCDVHLVYHKSANELRCHYCGFKHEAVNTCPSCSSTRILVQGFGTEKIEDELSLQMPSASIARLDLDAVRTKTGHEMVISDFEEGKTDILVGTQMVTKGLDFENVSLVGILSADQILSFPDFRASERAFQLMTQVAGRAGRKNVKGVVMIQTHNPTHPVVQHVSHYRQEEFYTEELSQRNRFEYPPFTRIIQITMRHKKQELSLNASYQFVQALPRTPGYKVLGPVAPGIARVRGKYIIQTLIKVMHGEEKQVRYDIRQAIEKVKAQKQFSGVDIIPDVDPV